ncbi:hypothetical protein [Streptomyces glomeratus]|uniref:hypothetical protein n=1 Tax=Streptomyces glomeratus TaxID=284452 RepID=UPI0031D74FA1
MRLDLPGGCQRLFELGTDPHRVLIFSAKILSRGMFFAASASNWLSSSWPRVEQRA